MVEALTVERLDRHRDKVRGVTEERLCNFSGFAGISMGELDLLLWSWKTGKVLK